MKNAQFIYIQARRITTYKGFNLHILWVRKYNVNFGKLRRLFWNPAPTSYSSCREIIITSTVLPLNLAFQNIFVISSFNVFSIGAYPFMVSDQGVDKPKPIFFKGTVTESRNQSPELEASFPSLILFNWFNNLVSGSSTNSYHQSWRKVVSQECQWTGKL